MNLSIGNVLSFAWVFALTFVTLGAPVRADDFVANPQYTAWEKFPVGANSTLAADITRGPNTAHIENTFTLKAISADEIELEYVSKVSAMGNTNNPQAVKRIIKSKAPAREVKELESKDVAAAGKTYHCKVIELTGKSAMANGPRPNAASDNAKAVVYVSSEVPGGIVKLDFNGPDGKVVTFMLTAVNGK